MLIGTFYYLGSRPYNSINFFRLKYGKLLCNLFCYVNMYLQGIINVVIWQIFTRTHILKRDTFSWITSDPIISWSFVMVHLYIY